MRHRLHVLQSHCTAAGSCAACSLPSPRSGMPGACPPLAALRRALVGAGGRVLGVWDAGPVCGSAARPHAVRGVHLHCLQHLRHHLHALPGRVHRRQHQVRPTPEPAATDGRPCSQACALVHVSGSWHTLCATAWPQVHPTASAGRRHLSAPLVPICEVHHYALAKHEVGAGTSQSRAPQEHWPGTSSDC